MHALSNVAESRMRISVYRLGIHLVLPFLHACICCNYIVNFTDVALPANAFLQLFVAYHVLDSLHTM